MKCLPELFSWLCQPDSFSQILKAKTDSNSHRDVCIELIQKSGLGIQILAIEQLYVR